MNEGIDNLVWTSWRAALVIAVVTLALTFSQGTSLAAEKMSLVDINTASQAELEAVTGVGPAAAKKIIANRPYKSLDELSKAGLSANQVESFKSSLTIGGAAAPAAVPASRSAGCTGRGGANFSRWRYGRPSRGVRQIKVGEKHTREKAQGTEGKAKGRIRRIASPYR